MPSVLLDGDAVRHRIALAGLTQTTFARVVDLDTSTLSKALAGRKRISGPALKRLAVALGCATSDLVTEPEAP